MGRGGGQVVNVLTLYSHDPSSNPAEAYSFSVKFVFEKNKNKQKRPGVAQLLNIGSPSLVVDKQYGQLSHHFQLDANGTPTILLPNL